MCGAVQLLGGPICYGERTMNHENTERLQSAAERVRALGGFL
jgi:hypothetical protein